MNEPLDPVAARKLIREILKNGGVAYSDHALEEMAKEKPPLTELDCENVLRGGAVEFAEWEVNKHGVGSWRYRVHSYLIWVVVAFRSETALRVVTAWRKKR